MSKVINYFFENHQNSNGRVYVPNPHLWCIGIQAGLFLPALQKNLKVALYAVLDFD